MKDNFSSQADKYARFRPTYPEELYHWLLTLVPDTKVAWDCGTGNGQVARELVRFFEKVEATDISSQQIKNAPGHVKINYSVQSAEKVSFPDNSFDLITVAQAIHWFDFTRFYQEVYRTIKARGILAVVGYGLIQTFQESDAIIANFYQNVVGPYWDPERRYLDENYQTIPFPFPELETPELEMKLSWTFDHLIEYLETWSAVKHYRKKKNQNPIDLIYPDLKSTWGHTMARTVKFPILLRVGRIEKNLSTK